MSRKSVRKNSNLAVGHVPRTEGVETEAKKLLKNFQSNLLSLISHELKTPLMGIMNSVSLLNEMKDEIISSDQKFEIQPEELIMIAQRNAHRLHHSLNSLLDLAAIESGTFHVRLREVDFPRVISLTLEEHRKKIEEAGIEIESQLDEPDQAEQLVPVLGDPKKLSSAVHHCIEVAVGMLNGPNETGDRKIIIKGSSNFFEIIFKLSNEGAEQWKTLWTEADAGFNSGALSPNSAFSGLLQSEEDFLSRPKEGLGSELMLIFEIMRLHHGEVKNEVDQNVVSLSLNLPELSSREALLAVLSARINEASTGLGSVALGWVGVPKGETIADFRLKIRKSLFRASDAVYAIPEENVLAIVMDDCRLGDAPHLLKRIEKALGHSLHAGIVTCPEEGADPDLVLELAEGRFHKSKQE